MDAASLNGAVILNYFMIQKESYSVTILSKNKSFVKLRNLKRAVFSNFHKTGRNRLRFNLVLTNTGFC